MLSFIRYPQFHILKTGFTQFRTNLSWNLTYHPAIKAFDKSGYRQYDRVSRIRPFTFTSVNIELNKLRNQGYLDTRLPFMMLPVEANGHADLIVLELAVRPTRAPPSFNPASALALQFQAFRLIRTFPRVENLALKWFYNGHPACAAQATFGCHHRGKEHKSWKMCPLHLKPFLHFFPALRQVNFILELDKSRWTKSVIDTYIKNYFTTKRGTYVFPQLILPFPSLIPKTLTHPKPQPHRQAHPLQRPPNPALLRYRHAIHPALQRTPCSSQRRRHRASRPLAPRS